MADQESIETVARGKAIYQERIQSLVENEHVGKVIAIEVNSGDYGLAQNRRDEADALGRLRARHSDPRVFRIRAGYPAVGKLGGTWRRLAEGDRLRTGQPPKPWRRP